MGVLDDYMGQVGQYDAGKPRTSVRPKPSSKFQPTESAGMSMPSPASPASPPSRVDTSALRGKMNNMVAEDAGFRSATAQPMSLKFQPTESAGMSMPSPNKTETSDDFFARRKSRLDSFDASRKGFSGRLREQPPRGTSVAKTDISSMLNFSGYDGEDRPLSSVVMPKVRSALQNSAISVPGMDKTPTPGGNYDETGWRGAPRNSVGTTTPNLGLPSGDSQKVINDRSASGMERFDPKKLTLGNTPGGGVGIFKGDEMLDVAGAQKQLGINKAPGTFMGKVNTDKASGMIDFTKQFAQDDKIFKMRMQNAQTDPKFFTGPGEPGAGTYGPNSEASAFRSRRDALAAQVDDYNRKNPITSGMSVGDIVSNAMATSQARKEIKHIDEQIFGRTELANKIMTALIGKDSALGAQALENEGKLATQQLENTGIMDARRLMETGETLRNRESIVAGRYAGKGNEDLEKKKTKLELLKSLGVEGYKGKIAAGDYDGASKFATDFMTQYFGDDDELNAIFK